MKRPPSGSRVEFTERGFTMPIAGAPPAGNAATVRKLLPAALVVEGIGVFAVMSMFIEGDLEITASLMGFAVVMLVVTALGYLLYRRVSVARSGTLELDNDTLSYPTPEGERSVSLADVKAIDLVPVGLAVRLRTGPSHHIVMPDARDDVRRWLDSVIEDRREAYGTADEVPDDLDALKSGRGRAKVRE